jgi:hypothetical protein
MENMSISADPSLHQEHEKQLIAHVERLLADDRLRIDTTRGRRSVVSLRRTVTMKDREVDLIRLMSDLGLSDRAQRSQMPIGRSMTINLSRDFLFLFRKVVGRLRIVCLPPWQDLLQGNEPAPMGSKELRAAMTAHNDHADVPTTIVAMSTSGFTLEAHELAERRADRTLILIEPNQKGGWTVTGPAELKALTDLFDPERDADKRERVHEAIESRRAELLSGGISADKLASATHLPLQLVEEELKSYAAETDGLMARRLNGNVVLFRNGSASAPANSGGFEMPFMQRVKALFSGKGDNEKKIALLSERRAGLSIQRDRAFEEMGVLESREVELRQQFKDTASSITRRRLTSQLVQLRKDLERRQQLLGMLNQQINVVSTHLHNLELVQQGQSASLPDSEELANDAAAAEAVLAELQADGELAGSIGAVAGAGMSDEEQALYEELEREAGGPAKAKPSPIASAKTITQTPAEPEAPEAPQPKRQLGEAEPG